MTSTKHFTRIAALTGLLLFGAVVAGCQQQTEPETPAPQNEQTQPSKAQSSAPVNQDAELTKQLSGENLIASANVYVQNDSVVGAMVLKDTATEADAKKLAQTYGETIKQKYQDKKVHVQAVSKGKNLATIDLE